jgi:hypothetical protein
MRESPYLHPGRKHGTHAYCCSPEPTPERVNLEGFKCLTRLARVNPIVASITWLSGIENNTNRLI